MQEHATVAVLLATYNGAPYLDAQLESLAAQTYPHVHVCASDDGSRDQTGKILARWARRWSKGAFLVREGPRDGFARNFASLLISPGIEADHYAFCDQDDVWAADKVEHAVEWLMAGDGPRVFCGRTRLIGPKGQQLGLSPLFRRRPDFRNALVQSIAGGNTMVFNQAARALLAESCRRTTFVSHDWWTYMLVTGAGGTVHYDPEPRVAYRQHAANVIGMNDTLLARLYRLRRVAGGQFRAWNETNVAALHACRDLLTDEASVVLDAFAAARRGPLPLRPLRLARTGVFRQTRDGQAALYVANLLGRI